MKTFIQRFTALVIGSALAVSAGSSAQAAMFSTNTVPAAVHSQIILVGSSKEIRQNGIDSRNKYNPNAALIGQMLGGAKSLDIDGLGRADVSPRHYAFCVRKYGSYRFEDNTYLQFSGERTQCISPFWDGD